ncbi:MAG: 2-C-methyl-D-erythritol 2,4-cyclodiphosphate synthase [Clostridiales bacterium]|jgi:2-C-methyl-D-erythritol 4-phosphate cytidylyltransferase/2-C-methyl-D-erythritol 2,4-cyclodiphosphate synthase|nr:2-C-methyl-D-erythritol 2,4-cyclodiphosphate synthase [Clostridiales bacterium]
MNINVIIAASGRGRRAGTPQNKIFSKAADGKTALEYSAASFICINGIQKIIVAARPEESALVRDIFSNGTLAEFFNAPLLAERNAPRLVIVDGGETRGQTVQKALSAVDTDCDIVLIHDAARPYVKEPLIQRVIADAARYGSSIPALKVTDTLKHTDGSNADRSQYLTVAAPQGFAFKEIQKAYSLLKDGEEFTDDSAVYKKYIGAPHMTAGQSDNIKITTPDDVEMFSVYRSTDFTASQNTVPNISVGNGYDLHKLIQGGALILGGVHIPHPTGLDGHSDADVLTHSIIDALLSAAGESDIGTLFPDDDALYKDANSIGLLKKVGCILSQKNLRIINISSVIIAEAPKLSPFTARIKDTLAAALALSPSKISIACKTNEGCGAVGKRQAIAVHSVCLLSVG